MSYVRSIADIENNAFTLLDVIHRSGNRREEAIKLVKGGKVFYPIQYEDFLAFVPSKFIGYLHNTVEKHEAVKRDQLRDGRLTNEAIRKILGKPAEDSDLEERLAQYCQSLGVELEAHKHSFWRIEAATRFTAPSASAINDLFENSDVNDDPEYKRRMAGSYMRDDAVRREVLARANGQCEYGATLDKDERCSTFEKLDGKNYLEAHHIIKLSEQGRDQAKNVIALCANHHREAHFGKNWRFLQDEFDRILSTKLGN